MELLDINHANGAVLAGLTPAAGGGAGIVSELRR